MKIGRNDPCPCGSGKKYKKCCLREGSGSGAAPPDPQQEREYLRETAFAALLRFADRPQFRDARDAAFCLFMGDGMDDLGEGEEPIDEDVHLKFSFFYLFDLRLPDGRTVAETFLRRVLGDEQWESFPDPLQSTSRRCSSPVRDHLLHSAA